MLVAHNGALRDLNEAVIVPLFFFFWNLFCKSPCHDSVRRERLHGIVIAVRTGPHLGRGASTGARE